jgi:hypothetical protein
MFNDSGDFLQVAIHRIASPTRLKLLPGITDRLDPSPKPSLWSVGNDLVIDSA